MAATDLERLVVSLSADIKKYENAMNRANGVTNKNMRSIERKVVASNSKVADSFRNTAASIALVHGPLGGVASRFSAAATLLTRGGLAAGGAAVGLGALAFAANKAVNAYKSFEAQQLILNQVLRATGGAAGKTAQDIEALAQSIGMGTLASTTDARDAAAQLLTFRSIAGETFDRTLRLAQDLATVGFGTLKTSAVQLGKALEDPATGLTALRRVGVSFSEAQRQVINDLYDTGQVAKAQEKILDALEQQVGGAGAASGKGLAGAYDTLSEATQILLERWGSQIATALNLQGAIFGIASAIDAVNARAGLGGQIAAIDRNISARRDNMAAVRSTPGMANTFTEAGLKEDEKELQALYHKRGQLLNQLDRERKAQDEAAAQGTRAQKALELERAQGELAATQKILELAGKTVTQKEIANSLANAGVDAESEIGRQIVKNLEAAAAAEKRLKDSGKKPKAKKDNEYERETQSLLRQIEVLNAETEALRSINPLINDYGYATEKAKVQQELLNAAQKAGLITTASLSAASPELADSIETLASQYANASVEAQKLAENQDAVREAAEDFKSTSKDVMSGFISDLRSGKSASEALANALNKVADKLLDVALNSAFGIGKTGKSGGGIGGILGGLFKFLGFKDGGYTGNGGKNEPAGIVHKGEYVMDAATTKRIGVRNLRRLQGYSQGGLVGSAPTLPSMAPAKSQQGGHITVTAVSEVQNGNLVPTMTVVAGQVAGRQIKQVNRNLQGRLQTVQTRGV